MQVRIGLIAAVVTAVFGALCSAAFAVTPGWECVPAAVGQTVTSGGTGSSPACGSSSTAVLAPTYVATGVGGKATVQFSGVNVQVVNGSGSETTINGEGNLVIGYNPSPGTQTGSHNLLLSTGGQSDTSYGGIDVGFNNVINNPSASVLGGNGNKASGPGATVTGGVRNDANGSNSWVGGGSGNQAGDQASVSGGSSNSALGDNSSVSGGASNIASNVNAAILGGYRNTSGGIDSSITGGEYNFARDGASSIAGGCDNLTGNGTLPSFTCDPSGSETVAGGWRNTSRGPQSSVSGGALNISSGSHTSVSGGGNNTATDGPGGGNAWVGGGASNIASNVDAAILGGVSNTVSSNCGTFPNTGQSC
jgi:hypothetical protein